MTKYVLNSGGAKNYPDLQKQFHQELVKELNNNPKFVLCNFAQGREYWESKFPSYCDMITKDMPDGTIPTFELAMPDKFVEQCLNANVIYFHGGDDHLLQYWMRQFQIEELFKGKVVGTSSASSDMLAKYFWTCDWRQCRDGFGILPIKFIPHYKSNWGEDDSRGPIDWEKAYIELAKFGDKNLPIHALKEGEFIVMEK